MKKPYLIAEIGINHNGDIKEPKKKLSVKYFKSNITNENDLKKILKFFQLKKIKIDVLINNAAIDYPPLKSKKK